MTASSNKGGAQFQQEGKEVKRLTGRHVGLDRRLTIQDYDDRN